MKSFFSGKISPLSLLWLLSMLLFACTPEEPVDGEEEIDTVRLIVGGQTIDWKVDDTVSPTITLSANDTLNVEVQFWNLADNENVTEEILAEAAEHLVCYDVSGANLQVTITDSDGTYPLGLTSTWITGAGSSGTLVVELRHQPGEKNGTCTPGDTDAQADFTIEIQ